MPRKMCRSPALSPRILPTVVSTVIVSAIGSAPSPLGITCLAPLFLAVLAERVDLLLEGVEAVGQFLDAGVAGAGLPGGPLARAGLVRRRHRGEGREHLHGLLEQRQILLAHFFQRAEWEEPAERVLEILAHLLLVAREGRHGVLEIARHEPLHAVAVEADELAEKAD